MSPLICDFGLTKNEEFDITSEATKNSRTARWMCPTVVNGDHQTEKTDIFSFGMTIAEILTGQHPFPLLSKFNVQLAFHRGQRPPPEPLPSNGKRFAPLWKLAALCWEQKPSDRPNAKDVESTLTSLEHTSVNRWRQSITLESGQCPEITGCGQPTIVVNRRIPIIAFATTVIPPLTISLIPLNDAALTLPNPQVWLITPKVIANQRRVDASTLSPRAPQRPQHTSP
ncbi:hypothetical protein FRB95_005650 [Tulasnella sp. JGI-2019a]|nr:hypothetical protein FRB93_007118 [Tulasnella sp. JGI-2019a]KAG9029107.1 hypothetical protein FRB95_005650 [Tulasnella sp. JGI-2019a]